MNEERLTMRDFAVRVVFGSGGSLGSARRGDLDSCDTRDTWRILTPEVLAVLFIMVLVYVEDDFIRFLRSSVRGCGWRWIYLRQSL